MEEMLEFICLHCSSRVETLSSSLSRRPVNRELSNSPIKCLDANLPPDDFCKFN